MGIDNRTIRIFMLPQRFPCGPQSSCCGPIGQTEEEIQSLKDVIEKELDAKVEVIDVTKGQDMKNYLQIVRLVRSMGFQILPIITLNDEIVSVGMPEQLHQAILAIKEKMRKKEVM